MSEARKIIPLRDAAPADDSARLAVTLTVGELRGLIAEVVRETVNHSETDALMDVEEAAKFIRQSQTYVYRNWRDMGGRKLGKNLRFTKADLQNWIESKGA